MTTHAYSRKRREDFVRAYLAGDSALDISLRFGVSQALVTLALRQAGITYRHRTAKNHDLGDRALIAVRDPKIHTWDGLSSALDVHPKTVDRHVRRAGRHVSIERLFKWRQRSAARQRVLKEMRQWIAVTGSLPPHYLPAGASLRARCSQHWGSWNRAVAELGFSPRPVGHSRATQYAAELRYETPLIVPQ